MQGSNRSLVSDRGLILVALGFGIGILILTVFAWVILLLIHRRWFRQRAVTARTRTETETRSSRRPEPTAKRDRNLLSPEDVKDLLSRYKEESGLNLDDPQDSNFVCPICLEGGDTAEGVLEIVKLPGCGHAYHLTCARLFLLRGASNRCPICQANIAEAYRKNMSVHHICG